MTCLTKARDIRLAIKPPGRLQDVIDFVKSVACARESTLDATEITRQWKRIRELVGKDRPIPPYARIHEAITSQSEEPPPAWCQWFHDVVVSGDASLPDAGAIDAIASQLEGEMEVFGRIMAQLPRHFLEALGPEYWPRRRRPWVIRARLRESVTIDSLDAKLTAEVEAAGGPSKFVLECTHWLQLKPVLRRAQWKLEWPDILKIVKRIESVLDEGKDAGRDDYAATVEDVSTLILEELDRAHPQWFPRNGSEKIATEYEEQLLAGIIHPPRMLIKGCLESAVQREFELEEISDQFSEALRQLYQAEEIGHRIIRHTPAGCVEPRDRSFLFRRAPGGRKEDADAPLSGMERYTLEIISSLEEGQGIIGKDLICKLRQHAECIEISQSTLTTHIIPKLKKRFGVMNRRGVGYFIP